MPTRITSLPSKKKKNNTDNHKQNFSGVTSRLEQKSYACKIPAMLLNQAQQT